MDGSIEWTGDSADLTGDSVHDGLRRDDADLKQGGDELNRDSDRRSQPNRLVLVAMNDYRPAMTFRVVGRLPAQITIQLLRLPNDETVPVLERPDEYTGYVVRSNFGDEQVDSTTAVFTRDLLEPDVSYAFLADALVFSERLKLFSSVVRSVDDGGGNGEADENSDGETDEGGGETDRVVMRRTNRNTVG